MSTSGEKRSAAVASLDPEDESDSKKAKVEAEAEDDVWIEVRQGEWSTHVQLTGFRIVRSAFINAAIDHDTRVLEFVAGTFRTRAEFVAVIHILTVNDGYLHNIECDTPASFLRYVHLLNYLGCEPHLNLMFEEEETIKLAFTAEECIHIAVTYKRPEYIPKAMRMFRSSADVPSQAALAAMWPYLRLLH